MWPMKSSDEKKPIRDKIPAIINHVESEDVQKHQPSKSNVTDPSEKKSYMDGDFNPLKKQEFLQDYYLTKQTLMDINVKPKDAKSDISLEDGSDKSMLDQEGELIKINISEKEE